MENKSVRCGKLNISNKNPFTLIAGPCQLESEEHALSVAMELFGSQLITHQTTSEGQKVRKLYNTCN